jgi:hypothetical protein
MLRSTIKSWVNLLRITALFLLAITSVEASKGDAIDLSIIEQSDALIPYMTASQRIQFLKLETAIKDAQSKRRSGQYLAKTKPSTFDPDRDIKSIIKRGEQMIESANLSIQTKQIDLVTLLTTVDSQRTLKEAIGETRFEYVLEASTYGEAMATRCQELLEKCWELGYETLFFDGVFTQDSEGTQRSDAQIHNDFYDTLTKIDGRTFSVTIPVDFELKVGTLGKSSQIFSYENEAIFEQDKKALLAIELIRPEGSSSGLLSLRAIDLESQLIAVQVVVKVDDLAEALSTEGEMLKDALFTQVTLRDPSNTLKTLARLGDAYIYEIESAAPSYEVAEMLTHTLLNQTNLQLSGSDFILRAYGESLDQPDTWEGPANARLIIAEGDGAKSYQLSAQSNGSDRTLPCGELIFGQSLAEQMAVVD